MKISGAMIIRNGVKLGYPFVQSVKSILPVCDEFVAGVGDSEDGTRDRIAGIGDPKIKILDTKWDMAKRTGGLILSEQTNLVLEKCSGEWVFYIQADEVALEKDLSNALEAILAAEKRPEVEGLAFDYVHFYGSYYTIQKGRNWYDKEVRIIRNRAGIVSHGDAQGFRKDGRKIRAIDANARMYHYGWARPPEVMAEKVRSFHRFWHDDSWIEENCGDKDVGAYFSDLGNLAAFTGEHPDAMAGIVNRDSEGFIMKCRGEYLKKRSLKEMARDFLRGLPLGRHRNFMAM